MATRSRKTRTVKERPRSPDALETPWRLFLAVPLPADVQAFVGQQIASLEEEGWPVRWVQSDMAHLTLHFLGDTEPERTALVRLALPGVVAAHQPFGLRTAAFGVLPNFRRPRVLWLGLHGPVHRLESLQQDTGRALADLNFQGTSEPYHPHITLGRVRNNDSEGVRLRDLPQAVKARFVDPSSGAAVAPGSLSVPVREVLLMRSHLGGEGPRYETVAAFPLDGPSTEQT